MIGHQVPFPGNESHVHEKLIQLMKIYLSNNLLLMNMYLYVPIYVFIFNRPEDDY